MDHICTHCGKGFKPNPRVKNQKYCNYENCQKARRNKWYREKLVKDRDYRDNQRRCQKDWLLLHPCYYKEYRAKHPRYVERNRVLQLRRNAKRGKDKVSRMIAKIDSLDKAFFSRKGELFKLIPQDERMIAKIDSFIVKLIPCKELGSYG
ncbi:MAG: hypothetical protein KKG01_03695 [Candidatus Omnitrophica bacterium]|nr:hypothetical protein [Candidatus Omnitrophota bacterium]MBU4590007.1 hypothetical protein [Candidatus Omnitrophota bacterium]